MTTTNKLNVGDKVGYDETHRDTRWTKIGTVIEINEDGRCRVKWEKWVYASGFERVDTKRTWVKAARLKLLSA
jgi:hypothetical protein